MSDDTIYRALKDLGSKAEILNVSTCGPQFTPSRPNSGRRAGPSRAIPVIDTFSAAETPWGFSA